jgi:propionyl-CoA carboxylase beta chain
MNSKHIKSDLNYAWPTAEIAVMGAKGASEIIFRKEIAASDDKAQALKEKEDAYQKEFAHPYKAAARGFVDEVIIPSETRRKLIRAFDMLKNKKIVRPYRKHGNIPL